MTFSDYAKVMYNNIGGKRKIDEFMHELLSNAVDPDSPDVFSDLSSDTFQKYYNGRRSVAPLAKKILPIFEPDCFAAYLDRQCSGTVVFSIMDDLKNSDTSISVDHFADDMALLLQHILKESISSKKKPLNTNYNDTFMLNYFGKLRLKYILIKTLLYTDEPQPFYDFYVMNNISQKWRSVYLKEFNASEFQKCPSASTLRKLSNFIILSGTGGLGKSMMMRHLLLDSIEHYERDALFPIYVALKDYQGKSENLFDHLYSSIISISDGLTTEELTELMADGKCLILLDGLDELKSDLASEFQKKLEELIDKFPESMYIISSRPFSSFAALSRFSVLDLQPFTKKQALCLVDKLKFRPDEPIIKSNFRLQLEQKLFDTHRSFTENPLLLTIMLMTYEQFAEIPSKMHIFYHEAYLALSQRHDANKGGYKRKLRTELSSNRFEEYMAEFCARTYCDEKFELSEEEFRRYFNDLKERRIDGDAVLAADFQHDLIYNICLMYAESGLLHFTHRSFQEYFCALFFSRQKDRTLSAIGSFFENRTQHRNSDTAFQMLYDMIPKKVEEYIFIPFLQDLFDNCDAENGYWTFLQIMYPYIQYEKGETKEFYVNSPSSYTFDFITRLKGISQYLSDDDLPFCDDLVVDRYYSIVEGWQHITDYDDSESFLYNTEIVSECELDSDYDAEIFGEPELVGWSLEIDVEHIIGREKTYPELVSCMNSDEFILKKEYKNARKLLQTLKEEQQPSGSSLFDLF